MRIQPSDQSPIVSMPKYRFNMEIDWAAIQSRFKSLILIAITTFLVFLFLWIVFGDAVLPPNSPVFTLAVMYAIGLPTGACFGRLKLPPLLGLLLAGLFTSNVLLLRLPSSWASVIRQMAVAVILLRGGLGLEWSRLRRTAGRTFRLTLIPLTVETVAVACFSFGILKLPWLWCFLLGLGVTAVSPAVVVPEMLWLQEQKLGTVKGIPMLVIAACGIEAVFVVTAFTVVAGQIVSTPASIFNALHVPLELVGGTVAGLLAGISMVLACRFLDISRYRWLYILVTGLIVCTLQVGGGKIRFAGAGALSVMIFSCFIANRQPVDDVKILRDSFKIIWSRLAEPLLFTIVGASISVRDLDGVTVGYGCIIILLGIIPRCGAAWLAVSGAGFNSKEKAFICASWISKATVQAAVSSIPLDLLKASGNASAEDLKLANQLLTIVVLSIFLTAPASSVMLQYLGPRWLEKEEPALDNLELLVIEDPNDMSVEIE
eukprot:Partr_v1_DN26017_c0_g1_i1_m383 putative Solute carrier family 9, subfamily B (NHA2, cation proton antiporter 2), member 2